jgi:FKBP-type peptidyl-prolyl cis-trans isomerase
MNKLKIILGPFLMALIFGSCISEEENLDAIYAQDLQNIEDYIQTVDFEYMKRETVGQTGIVLLFTEVVEEGELPEVRDSLDVNYTGKLLDGSVFDTSIEQVARDNDIHSPSRTYEPFRVVLGLSSVIDGWHWALSEMKEGEKATALIPSAYAYGTQGRDPFIPPNSVLIFDLEMVNHFPFDQ